MLATFTAQKRRGNGQSALEARQEGTEKNILSSAPNPPTMEGAAALCTAPRGRTSRAEVTGRGERSSDGEQRTGVVRGP